MKKVNQFYLDKEKDIVVNLYQENPDEMIYILETPNHGTGNLITNLAKLCGVETQKDENDMKNVKEQGADAVLIGETFMRSDNIKETMKQLRSCL